jgi:hypothetical protein
MSRLPFAASYRARLLTGFAGEIQLRSSQIDADDAYENRHLLTPSPGGLSLLIDVEHQSTSEIGSSLDHIACSEQFSDVFK